MCPVPRPTLADIARAAEVSTATVSHALNGTGRLGQTTRRRVREVATALGYGAPQAPAPAPSASPSPRTREPGTTPRSPTSPARSRRRPPPPMPAVTPSPRSPLTA
ncbi:LacI family DNA-binding transcriptional regulator [Streptomyces rectiviolaceus]|uniref:LacI family DNA-binding transcriptional regulator n=1 Tax=Streptomyces rectiviolaceus TaxID=332591 RepID=UPI003635BE90